jgi:hypothetical protein
MTPASHPVAVWLDPTLAARHIGFAPATLAKYRCNGQGPRFSRVNRSIRYHVDQLDQWLQEHSFASTSGYAQ